MKTITKTLGLAVLAAFVAGATSVAANAQPRGPLPFKVWDTNNDGVISKVEFNDMRAKRRAARAAEGRMLRNAANAPSFRSIDKNGDGTISRSEFASNQALRQAARPRGRGLGKGPGRGMGRGMGQGMGRGMGMRPCAQK